MENKPAPFTVELKLQAKGMDKPVFSVKGMSKSNKTRTDEVDQYLKGEKTPPHAVIATLTGTSPAYVRQRSYNLKNKKE